MGANSFRQKVEPVPGPWGETSLGCWRAEMPGDVEHLGVGERSAWGGGLDTGALLQGSWYRVCIKLGYSGKSWERFDQGNEVM